MVVFKRNVTKSLEWEQEKEEEKKSWYQPPLHRHTLSAELCLLASLSPFRTLPIEKLSARIKKENRRAPNSRGCRGNQASLALIKTPYMTLQMPFHAGRFLHVYFYRLLIYRRAGLAAHIKPHIRRFSWMMMSASN